jgi:hypothetical protein
MIKNSIGVRHRNRFSQKSWHPVIGRGETARMI